MFDRRDSADQIEGKLAQALESVTRIGELSLTDADRKLINDSLRASPIHHVPPRLLLTAMVFCARHAKFDDDETINFWGRFFSDVLRTPKEMSSENACREAFRKARAVVQAAHGFEFPTRQTTTTDVVSGIYLHAILPAYLQDEFAGFFLRQYPDQAAWHRLNALFPDEIARQNQKLVLNPPTPKRLIHFLVKEETSLTAARLIQNMATASLWYSEGLSGDAISEVLSQIERAVWQQLAPKLARSASAALPPRARSARVRWAWLIEQNDILELHARNLRIDGDTPPDRLVALTDAQKSDVQVGQPVPDYGRRYCEVNAYRTSDGCTIDNAILIDIDEAAVLVAVDQHDRALTKPIEIDSPPSGPAFFRIQPDGQLAILSDTARLTDGEYAVSLPAGVKLTAAEGGSVTHEYALAVPKVLAAHGHTTAARCRIILPILLGDERIDRKRGRIAPTLHGAHPVSDLLPGALAVYQSGALWLRLVPPDGVPFERLFVRLSASDTVRVYALSELDQAGHVTREEADVGLTLRIELEPLVEAACLLQAEVFSGVTRMHGDARMAGLLPRGVQVRASPTDRRYTPSDPPHVRIDGVTTGQVELASDARISADDGGLTITWVDPRQDAALRLKFDSVSIPLTFDVKWAHAWVSPLIGDFLWEDALDEAVLSIRGEPRARLYIAVADDTPVEYTLNARGTMDVHLREDRLFDVLKAYQGERVPVRAWFAHLGERFDLFTFIRPQFGEFERQPEAVKAAVRAFRKAMRQARRETAAVQTHEIVLLPRRYFETLPVESLPSPLDALSMIKPGSHPDARRAVLPAHALRLRLGDAITYPLHQTGDALKLSLSRRHSQGESRVEVGVVRHENGVMLVPSNTLLSRCQRCGDVYWSDDRAAKMQHGHGQFGIDGKPVHNLVLTDAQIKRMPIEGDAARACMPDLSPFIRRDLQSHLRVKKPTMTHDILSSKQDAVPLTRAAYEWATANWVKRMQKDGVRMQRRFATLYEAADWFSAVCAALDASDQPALIAAARWLKTEGDLRKPGGWEMLDPVVMALACTARAQAHGFDAALPNDQLERGMTLLDEAWKICPELLSWALAWAELILTHWSDESTS
jgi:hypothetical protein